MYNKQLSALVIPCAASVSLLYGCANIPSHDGSFQARYGLPPEQETISDRETQQVTAPAEETTFKPLIQTLADPASVETSPYEATTLPPRPEAARRATIPRQKAGNTATGITTAESPSSAAKYPARQSRMHRLGAGETLYSVATRFTGESANWKQIADFNGIESPDAMTVGQEILIPLHLVTTESGSLERPATYAVVSPSRSALDESASVTDEGAPGAEPPVPAENAVWDITAVSVGPATATTPDESQTDTVGDFVSAEQDIPDIGTLPATTKSDETSNQLSASADVIAPETIDTPVADQRPGFRERVSRLAKKIGIGPGTAAEATARSAAASATLTVPAAMKAIPGSEPENNDNKRIKTALKDSASSVEDNSQWIQIEGDFTPKAVYSGAGYDSELLMRVSPGTTMKLTRRADDWYEIQTSKGPGFVFHRDALIVEKSQ